MRLLHDSASTRVLCLPGMCVATSSHWCWAEKKAKQQKRCADSRTVEVLLFTAATIYELSDKTYTLCPYQSLPHITTAIRGQFFDGDMSVMEHVSPFQLKLLVSSESQFPEASEITVEVGWLGGGKMAIPFQ